MIYRLWVTELRKELYIMQNKNIYAWFTDRMVKNIYAQLHIEQVQSNCCAKTAFFEE